MSPARRNFGATWWGRAWTDALEHRARLDHNRLPRGRTYARANRGSALVLSAGELQPRCSCPDWADPCKHSAAVCYLVADELDADPFALFELRGRGRDRVLAELRRRRSGASAPPRGASGATVAVVDPGMVARAAWERPLAALARRSGLAPRELARRAIAWRHGGADGLRMIDETRWRPPTTTMAAARDAVVAGGAPGGTVQVDGNRLSLAGGAQLRLGRDGRWYRFEKSSGRWQLAAAGADDPEELLEPA